MTYIEIDELCDYLHLSKSTIYKATMSRRIPHIKLGKKLLFQKEAIDKWLIGFNQPTFDEVRTDISSLLKNRDYEK